MTTRFQKLKKNAKEELHRLQQRIAFEKEPEKGSRYRERIREALDGTADGREMSNCLANKGRSCGSVFCAKCRAKKQENMISSYRSHVADSFNNDERRARDRLRFVTVLHSVVAANHGSQQEEQNSIDKVVEAVAEMKLNLQNIARTARRKYDADIWLRGGVHIELIDYELFSLAEKLGKVTTKEDTIRSLVGRFANDPNNKYFIVHFHALVDKCSLKEDEFRELFTDKWSLTNKQVHIQRTWSKVRFSNREEKQTVDDGLVAMARYCFNMSNTRLEYARNWGAGNIVFETGEEVSASGHVEGFAKEVMSRGADKRLSLGDLRFLVQVHNAVNGPSHKGLVVGIY